MSLMMTTYRCGATAAAKDDGEDGYSSGWGEFEEVAAGSVAPHRPESSRRRVTRRSQTLVTACYRNVITPRACYQSLIRNIFSWSTRTVEGKCPRPDGQHALEGAVQVRMGEEGLDGGLGSIQSVLLVPPL